MSFFYIREKGNVLFEAGVGIRAKMIPLSGSYILFFSAVVTAHLQEDKAEYQWNEPDLGAGEFLEFARQVWPGDYDRNRMAEALGRAISLTVQENGRLVGSLRIHTDGYFFETITELPVLQECQCRGIGRSLQGLARQDTPIMLCFGVQPEDHKRRP